MENLSKEQIEKAREELLIDFDFTGTICDDINALCDMALGYLNYQHEGGDLVNELQITAEACELTGQDYHGHLFEKAAAEIKRLSAFSPTPQ